MGEERLPRARLKDKIEVLDYIAANPHATNADVVNHFKEQKRFSLSLTTLSGWKASEQELRKAAKDTPNLEDYRRMPVMKYPEAMREVESYVNKKLNDGDEVSDQMIQEAYTWFMDKHGHPGAKLSGGMLQAFKKRNLIYNKRKRKLDGTAVIPEYRSPLTPSTGIEFGQGIEDMFTNSIGFNTRLIHSDDNFSSLFKKTFDSLLPFDNLPLDTDVAEPLHSLSTPLTRTSSITTPSNVEVTTDATPNTSGSADVPRLYKLENFTYSRTTHPNAEKLEKILENITNGHVTIYNSGTSAIMGILTYLNPRKIAINNSGYQGTHQVIALLSKLTGLQKIGLEDYDQLGQGDVMLIETPMNPEGYCIDISRYTELVHSKGAKLIVDSTLAPPPLQDPFKHDADFILHSATKYFSGHSDLLAGFIVTKSKKIKKELIIERLSLGTNVANFDAFLLLRSLRTFKMRIQQQCMNTEKIVKFLTENSERYPVITKIHHSSLQLNAFVERQLNGFYNPVFAIEFATQGVAEELLTRFQFLSNNSNSEGGETIVELTNKNPDFTSYGETSHTGNLLRFSVGCEDYEDLLRDLNQALKAVSKI